MQANKDNQNSTNSQPLPKNQSFQAFEVRNRKVAYSGCLTAFIPNYSNTY